MVIPKDPFDRRSRGDREHGGDETEQTNPSPGRPFLTDIWPAAGFPPGVGSVVRTAPEDAPTAAAALIADQGVARQFHRIDSVPHRSHTGAARP